MFTLNINYIVRLNPEYAIEYAIVIKRMHDFLFSFNVI